MTTFFKLCKPSLLKKHTGNDKTKLGTDGPVPN
jgi:hypothetical protein